MFGFDGDDSTVFDETARFNIDADYDACAYSVLTPYPGTLTWYELKKANRIVSFAWTAYDQANVVYRPDAVAEPTPVPDVSPMPPVLPLKREWREAGRRGRACRRARSRSRQRPPNSARSIRAAATIDASLPLATARGRYFIPQSGASTMFPGAT